MTTTLLGALLLATQYARRFHNSAVRDLNDALQRVPDTFVARLAAFGTAGFLLAEDGSRRAVPVEWTC